MRSKPCLILVCRSRSCSTPRRVRGWHWLQGLLNTNIAMVQGSRAASIVCRASVRVAHIQDWFCTWVRDPVFSAGKGGRRWIPGTPLGKETSISPWRMWSNPLTLSIVIFPIAPWEGLGFQHYSEVRLRFKVATGLGVAWTRVGGVAPRCPFSMVFIVALHASWYRHLESLKRFSPLLYADNLKCNSNDVDTLFAAAQCTVSYVQVVGQEASPGKCVCVCSSALLELRVTGRRPGVIRTLVVPGLSSWMFATWVVILM